MSEDSIHDRYQVPPGNVEAEFVDDEQTVLVNKRGITDLETLQIAEEQALAHAYEQFLSIHPFREGNARTIKLLTDLLSLQTGRPLLIYDASDAGKEGYIDAAKAALLRRDNVPMITLIREALQRAQQP